MPLAFGAHAGSMLLLTGSPVNLVIADYAESAGVGPFGLFSFTFVGVPLVLGTLIIVVLFGPRLIPRRTAGKSLRDLGGQAAVLSALQDGVGPTGAPDPRDGCVGSRHPAPIRVHR